MSKRIRRRVRASQKNGPRSSSGASYRIGYGRPPEEHRFQRGQSGNQKGRPKGSKNTDTLLREILDRKIEVRTGGAARKISVREGMLTRFAESALKGDTKSAAFLLQRYDMAETGHEHANCPTTLEDHEIIDAFLKRHLEKEDRKK
jgi:hypothetical protein